MRNWRFRKHARHDLLGSRVLESTSLTPMWRNDIDSASISWLKNHCAGNDVVFPAAGYISMACAAACQLDLAHDTHDYTVRDVILRQALVLHDTRREDATTLRPQSLTTSLDSDWYEFEICSYDGLSWDKHCSGLVKSGAAGKTSAVKVARPSPLPRDVSASRWYTTLSRVGLNYGPRFTGLKNITASVTERTAVVDIQDDPGDGTESSYPLHPTTLDIMLQSWTVAAFQRVYGDFVTKFLPTYIRELYVGDGTGQNIRVKTTTASHSAAAGRERAEGQSFAVGTNNELVLQLKGFQGTPLPSEDDDADLTALQLQWKPDFSFLDAAKLTRPTYDFREQIALAEELCVMCALESQQSLLDVQATQPHFEKYRKWMKS